MGSSDWRGYLRWMFATVALVVVLCGAVTSFIDPLGLFDGPRVPGINAVKPLLDHHRELSRWRAAERLCPTAGIFGNSRAEIGFDPEHPAFSQAGLSAFNHAIPGTSLATSLRQLKWLNEAGCPPRLVVLGIDFFDFLGGDPVPKPRPGDDRIPSVDAAVLAETVFSVTALRDALATVLVQSERNPAITTPRGFNPLLQYRSEIAKSGHHALFAQRAQENWRNWTRKPHRLTPVGGGPSADDAALAEFLAIATRSAKTVHLVIYPYHAQIRLMIERAGLSELFSAWKRRMLVAAEKASNGKGSVVLWDFSGVSPETLEVIPPAGDRSTQLQFYWEAGHFKKELGDLMLDQVLRGARGFGVRMRQQEIDSWLLEDRRRVQDLLSGPSTELTRSVEALLRP
jgi:hypothetical protein